MVLLLPARSPASLGLPTRRLRGHPGNLEIPGVGRVLRAEAETHRGAAHVHDQASHRGLRCQIASVCRHQKEAYTAHSSAMKSVAAIDNFKSSFRFSRTKTEIKF